MEGAASGAGTKRVKRSLKVARRWLVAQMSMAGIVTASWLPFAVTRRVLPWLVRFLAPGVIRQADRHLAFAYGDALPRRERKRIARRVARNMGLFLAELLASRRRKIPGDYIDIGDAPEQVRHLLDEGKGLICITGHLGNWELLGGVFQESAGERAGPVIAKRNPNPWLNEFIIRSRRRLGWELVFQDQGVRPLLRALREGKMLGTVPDQDLRRAAGIFVPFFGHDAYTSTGPASLSVLSGAPILAGFLKRKRYGLELVLHEPLRPDPAADKEAEIERLTRGWSAQVEAQIREQPQDWMWFHRRWRTTRESLERRRAIGASPRDKSRAQ